MMDSLPRSTEACHGGPRARKRATADSVGSTHAPDPGDSGSAPEVCADVYGESQTRGQLASPGQRLCFVEICHDNAPVIICNSRRRHGLPAKCRSKHAGLRSEHALGGIIDLSQADRVTLQGAGSWRKRHARSSPPQPLPAPDVQTENKHRRSGCCRSDAKVLNHKRKGCERSKRTADYAWARRRRPIHRSGRSGNLEDIGNEIKTQPNELTISHSATPNAGQLHRSAFPTGKPQAPLFQPRKPRGSKRASTTANV